MSANRIALLRGINIGPRQRVKMPELRELMEGLGHKNVETLVQSGNVVFTSRAAPKTLEKQLETEIEKGLGVDPKVVVRTRDELAAVIEANPFPDVDNPKKNLHVTFFSGEPDAEAARRSRRPTSATTASPSKAARSTSPTRTGWGARSSPSS